jgi:hypothetical protein
MQSRQIIPSTLASFARFARSLQLATFAAAVTLLIPSYAFSESPAKKAGNEMERKGNVEEKAANAEKAKGKEIEKKGKAVENAGDDQNNAAKEAKGKQMQKKG